MQGTPYDRYLRILSACHRFTQLCNDLNHFTGEIYVTYQLGDPYPTHQSEVLDGINAQRILAWHVWLSGHFVNISTLIF